MLKLDKLMEFTAISGKKNDVAVIHNSTVLTWGDLEERTRALISYFAPKQYQRVVFLSKNRAELIPLYSAFSSIGVTFVGIDYNASMDEIVHCAKEIQADCLIYAQPYESLAKALKERLGIDTWYIESGNGDSDPQTDLSDYLSHRRPFESIMFTSGTTGFPKAVFRSKSFEARRFADVSARFGFGEETFIATIPFAHGSVTGWARLYLSLGGKLVLTDVDDPRQMYADVIEHQVTCMLISPPVFSDFIQQIESAKAPGTLKFVIVGGKMFPIDLKKRAIELLGPVVNEYYGSSETGMNVIGTSEDLSAFPESAGRIMDGSDVAILDPSNHRLPDGEIGKVAIATYQLMDGYLNGKAADFVDLDGQKYVVTADSGYRKEDRIFLLNRAVSVRTNFDLYALENGLRAFPGVTDVCSVAMDPKTIQLFVAQTNETDQSAVEAFANNFFNHNNGGAEMRLRFVPRIPYGMSGKARMRELLNAL